MLQPPRYVVLYDAAEPVATNPDCACPVRVTLPEVGEPPPLLRLHPALQRHDLDSDHTLMYVPSHSRVAVLNRASLQLLDNFSNARPWQTLAERERVVLETCYRLGLMTGGNADLTPPPPADTLVTWLHVTNACNLRCTYCYISKSQASMNADTGRAAIDAALRSAQSNNYRKLLLKYAGGEPTLNMALVEQMQRYAAERCAAAGIALSAGILSNGTTLTPQRLEQIRGLGLDLMISLDGLATDHDRQRPTLGGRGSVAAALAGIERARQANLPITVSVTVTSQNIDGLPELIQWLLDRQLHFSLNFYRPNAASQALHELHLEEERLVAGLRAAYAMIALRPPRHSLLGVLLDRTHLGTPHSLTCAVGENYLVIDHRGQISKCQMEQSAPVTTVMAPDPLALIRADQIGVRNIAVDQKAGCRSCEWRYWCAGGCSVATFQATGRYDVQSPNCGIYKALFPDVLRLEGLRLLYHSQRVA